MTDALERLIEAVKAGAFSNPGGPNRFNAFADAWEGSFGAYSQPDYSRAWRAYGHHDDMTAALSSSPPSSPITTGAGHLAGRCGCNDRLPHLCGPVTAIPRRGGCCWQFCAPNWPKITRVRKRAFENVCQRI